MGDAKLGEVRNFNLHSAGTDLVEGSALAIKSSSGAITVDGATVGSVNALYIQDPVAHDAADAGNPVKIGGRARTSAITAVANNDRVDAVFTAYGALNVAVTDASGVAQATGVQYVGDAAATSTPQGTMILGLANSAAPTDVSANNDAVAAWFLRNGAQATVLTAAGVLIGGDATNGLDVDVTRVTGTVTVDSELPTAAALADATANPTTTSVGALLMGYNGTTWDRVRTANTGRLQVDVITGGGGGTQYVGDAAATATPTGTVAMGLANAAAPTDVSANNDAVAQWMLRNGSAVINLASGGTLITIGQKTMANSLPVVLASDQASVPVTVSGVSTAANQTNVQVVDNAAFTDGATTLLMNGYIFDDAAGTALTENDAAAARVDSKRAQMFVLEDATTRGQKAAISAAGALASNITQVGGSTHSATVPLFARLTDGTAVYSKTGQTAATAAFAQLSDQTTAVNVIAGTNALKTDLSSVAGTATVTGGISGVQAIAGPTAADAAIAAQPLTIGGRGSTALPTAMSTDGDVANAWLSLNGAVNVILRDTAGTAAHPVAGALADATSNPTTYVVGSMNEVFNGTTWDRARAVASLSTAPNVTTGIPATGIGPGYDRKTDPTGIAATSTANAITVVVDGADIIVFQITTIGTTPGSMIFESTSDDSTWTTHGQVLKLGVETWTQGAFVPAVGDRYMLRSNGDRQVRLRVNAVYASGTVTAKVTAATGTAMVKTIDVAPAPHNIGWATSGVSAQYTSAQTSVTIGPTVSSTQRLAVTYLLIGAGGTTAATQVSVYFGTGAFSRGTSKAIFDHELAPSSTLKPGFAIAPPVPFIGAADEELKITSVGAANPLTVTIWYYLVNI